MNEFVAKILRETVRPLRQIRSHTGAALSYSRYLSQMRQFGRMGGRVTYRRPMLRDFTDVAGVARGHYFHQDLLVASLIHQSGPTRHIDIGSRIDGFVAHVAAFRPIDVIDIRPLQQTGHPNVRFIQADMMDDGCVLPQADSVSCLHAIEHFGLGRYGDPIDPEGHKKGFRNILKMVEPGGTLYISFPIARRNEVHFNAHRTFHPLDIFNWTAEPRITLKRFDYVDDQGDLHRDADPFKQTLDVSYGCGIYTLGKG